MYVFCLGCVPRFWLHFWWAFSEVYARSIYTWPCMWLFSPFVCITSPRLLTAVFVPQNCIGFTDISRTLPPECVMEMLNRLYQKFDAITTKHGLFKVRQTHDRQMTNTRHRRKVWWHNPKIVGQKSEFQLLLQDRCFSWSTYMAATKL